MTTFPEEDRSLLCVHSLFRAIYSLSFAGVPIFPFFFFPESYYWYAEPYQFEYVDFHWRGKDDHMARARCSTVSSTPALSTLSP
jgi:hypothetical protein